MASRDLKDLDNVLVNAYAHAKEQWAKLYPGLPQPFTTCTYRSNEEQDALFKQGVDNPKKKVTNARGGESPHNYLPSKAFDIAFITVDKKLDYSQDLFLKFWDIIKLIEPRVEWGGSWKFKDSPHYQLLNWKTYIK